jgi:hypothetical protein
MQTALIVETPPLEPPPRLDDDVLLTDRQVRARVGGVTSMCLWRWRHDPGVNFPAPIKINNRNYTPMRLLRRWHAERFAKPAACSPGESA